MTLRERLINCFTLVLVGVIDPVTASLEVTPGWDSLATLNLVAFVEEEFNCNFEWEEMEQLTSFEKFEQFLESRVPR